MAKLFYDHLIIIEDVVAVLDFYQVTKGEQEQLLEVIDQALNHQILDVILRHLPKEYHEEFLQKLAHHPYDPGILIFLKETTPVDIETKIRQTASNAKRKAIKQIHHSLGNRTSHG